VGLTTTRYEITSTSNPRVKRLMSFADRRHRDDAGVFVVEGRRHFDMALADGLAPQEIYVDGSFDLDHPLAVTVRPEVLDRVSYRGRSQGLVAVFAQRRWSLADISLADPALLLVAEGMEKPGNLGAIIRTAGAVAADAVVSVGGRVDLFNPNVLRASTGASLEMPVVETDLAELTSWLSDRGVDLVAATPDAPKAFWDVDLRAAIALLVGAEDIGITDDARRQASMLVSLPMAASGVDSLNASVTIALLAYECLRQRRKA
jgi:TrmH family RNA methyltransferase